MIEEDALRGVLQGSLDRTAARLVLLDKLPIEDPYEDLQVLLIKRTFGQSKVYAYAALRVTGVWYLTGEKHYRYGSTRSREPIGPGIPWDTLRTWLIESGDPQQLSIEELTATQVVV